MSTERPTLTEDQRETLRRMIILRQGLCRPDSICRDVEHMEELAKLGMVFLLPGSHVAIFQLTEAGRDEARASG